MSTSFFVVHIALHNLEEASAHYRGRKSDTWERELAGRLTSLVGDAARLASVGNADWRTLDASHDSIVLRVNRSEIADAIVDGTLRGANEKADAGAPKLVLAIGIHWSDKGDREVPVARRAAELSRALARDSANSVVVSQEVFKQLPIAMRDQYLLVRNDTEVYYRRFASGLPRCFVISPVGDPGDPVHQRAGHVFETYFKPACAAEGYRPVRADKEVSSAIRSEMMSALSMDPIAIAYLGRPPWNPNVMIEIGYRLAVNNQIVFIRDAKQDVDGDASWELPFDLSDITVLTLPASSDENEDSIAQSVSQLAKALKKGEGSAWNSEHAVATIDIGIDGNRSAILEASTEAARLFARDQHAANASLDDVIAELAKFMPDGQFEAFAAEQNQLIEMLKNKGRSVISLRDVTRVRATVPMFFEGHPDPDFDQRAFLPVIDRYKRSDTARVLRLTVLYLDVTSATRVDERGIFVCHLTQVRSELGLAFELYATSYDKILPQLDFYREVRDRHVAAMSTDGIERVLELGGGTGNVTIPLLDCGRKVTVVDPSHSMLAVLQQKVFSRPGRDDRIYILEQGAENLAILPTGHYDGVSVMLAFFAMSQPLAALHEAIRVLRPGGRIVITEPRSTFELKPLLEAAEAQLEALELMESLEVDWKRVSGVNRTINPEHQARARPGGKQPLRSERVVKLLTARGFKILSTEPAYLGHCQTIVAMKP